MYVYSQPFPIPSVQHRYLYTYVCMHVCIYAYSPDGATNYHHFDIHMHACAHMFIHTYIHIYRQKLAVWTIQRIYHECRHTYVCMYPYDYTTFLRIHTHTHIKQRGYSITLFDIHVYACTHRFIHAYIKQRGYSMPGPFMHTAETYCSRRAKAYIYYSFRHTYVCMYPYVHTYIHT